jgi:hypothetical protein
MWVFFWLITRDRGHRLAHWSNPDPPVAAEYKVAQVQSETDFAQKLATHFDPRLGAAADLRNAL